MSATEPESNMALQTATGDPAPINNDLEVDDLYELDSAYSSVAGSGSTSYTSGVFDYKYENGRRYHAYHEGHYWGPNDEKQNGQLEIFHHVFALALHGELYLAPISENPQKILDLGTGTGLWCIDMADKFPSATVIGNDLSATQSDWTPPNCTFEIDDFTTAWTHKSASFDFIHCRSCDGCVADWHKLFGEVYKALVPGGWFESVEIDVRAFSDDNTIPTNSAMLEWCDMICSAGARVNLCFSIASSAPKILEDVGFVNITETVIKTPMGPWAKDKTMKEIGVYNMLGILEGLEGFCMALFSRVMMWTPEQIQDFLEKFRAELHNPEVHAYYKIRVTYGQRPITDDPEADVDI